MTIPEGVTSIGDYAFYNCSSLNNMYFLGTKAKWNAVSGVSKGEFWDYGTPWNKSMHCLYTYTVADGNATITEYDGFGGDVVIPSTLDNYPVAAIGNSAFYEKTNVTAVTVPEGVTSIGNNAFRGCSNLETVTLPSTLVGIGSDAFYFCDKINRVNIADIAAWCIITFPDDASNPLALGSTFDKLYVGGELVHELVIPEGVPFITSYAFYKCQGLTSVSLPSTLEGIEYSAFKNCTALQSVTIPEGVINIGEDKETTTSMRYPAFLSDVVKKLECYKGTD